MAEMPSLDDVIKYGRPLISKFISEKAPDIPHEHKEEIEQTAYMRLCTTYPKIKADKGWKSYVYNHCRGAVLDYLKFGVGFKETQWTIAKTEQNGSKHISKIRERVQITDNQDEPCGMDIILGANGIFSDHDFDNININWELVSRMASTDIQLHCFAKSLRGYLLEEIGPVLGISRARVGQHIQSFIARFDDPKYNFDYWFLQCVYALGLCRQLGIPEIDQSLERGNPVGWNLPKVDLDSLDPIKSKPFMQLALFDFRKKKKELKNSYKSAQTQKLQIQHETQLSLLNFL